ncbi:hypothetical protein Aple_051020 [Acrocarpospora pleiomorpha]|uniref:Conjugal transfer protein TraI n=2 Tax=Acrocarpospora pleiomorpha TaxID=90975 RepID=A0A5M3XLE9_9ACTN|nr:hypothetical protein Aple_051020 [Acrocarpospora pleiomorpha]
MPITTPDPTPPDPEEFTRGLAALERHLADAAAPTNTAVQPIHDAPVVRGETRRVQRLRAQVAEAHLLADLQDDDIPLLLDSPKVRKRRRQAHEAARLHELSRQPAQLAYTASKARRRVNIGLTVALVLALGWSTAGVQVFASEGAPQWSPGWVFAWFVEPFMSIALLCFVGAKAFFGTRGQPANDRVLDRIEWLFLGLTLGMNAWPHLPWSLPEGEEFSFARLVLHILGPVVAYAVVTGWPRLLARFAALDHRLTNPLTVAAYSENTDPDRDHRKPFGGVRNGLSEGAHRERLRDLIASGQLPKQPSARAIQRALGCATETASRLRDELADPNPDPR